MSLSITFLGHSGLSITDGTHTLVVDPFLTGNPLAKHRPEEIRCDTLALTHGHGDHLGDTLAIAQANQATVVATFEICEYLAEQGHDRCEQANTGGRIETPFGAISFTPALHSSSFQGRYMGQPNGLVLEIGGRVLYHSGDTALFSDMQLIGERHRPDIAFLCCGDRFTMGPQDASQAAEWVGASTVVPIHWKTFPLLTSDLSAFKPQGIAVRVMEPGETWTLED